MKISDILTYPEASLLQKCDEITQINNILIDKAQEMLEFVMSGQGNGLAAPQVGLNQRLFVTKFEPHFFINPEFTKFGGKKITEEEACFSLPGLLVYVPRFTKVTIEYYDLSAQLHKQEFKNLEARIVQHEQDHLRGRLIIYYTR